MATVIREPTPPPTEPENIVIRLTRTEAETLKKILAWQKVVGKDVPPVIEIYNGLGDLNIDYTF